MRRFLISFIRLYQIVVSPLLGPRCRFYPTCSCYARTAIEHHGAWYGSWLAVKRIVRCGPWHPGGVDPVPEKHACRHGENVSQQQG